MKKRKFHRLKKDKKRVSDTVRHQMAPPQRRFGSKKNYNRLHEKRRFKQELKLDLEK